MRRGWRGQTCEDDEDKEMLTHMWSDISGQAKCEDLMIEEKETGVLTREITGGSVIKTEQTLLEAVEKERPSDPTTVTPRDLREKELSKRSKVQTKLSK